MDRALFRTRFDRAATLARDFARTFIEEPLPDEASFHLELNSSYDAGSSAELHVFPGDSIRGAHLLRMDLEQAVDELWRDGMVPQWIDVSVVGETEETTLIHVTCCGRFTADDALLYHQQSQIPPFHVTGPILPVGHEHGRRFSIYDRAHCWTADDLARAARHADKIWSLELHGPAFDDATLAAFGDGLRRVEILALSGTAVDGSSLGWLSYAPRLRVLRIATPDQVSFDFARLPALRELTLLSIAARQIEVRGTDDAAAACPSLTDLTLSFERSSTSVGQVALPMLSTLSVTGPGYPEWASALRPSTVHLHCPDLSTERVSAIVDRMRRTLDSVGLRGTPVDDSIFRQLARIEKLKYVDLVDTNVSHAALADFVSGRPRIKHWPRTSGG